MAMNSETPSFYTVLFFLTVLSLSPKAQNLSQVYAKVNPAVVVILTEEKAVVGSGLKTQTVTSAGLGSGFLISNKQIITAAHVVQVAEKVRVQFLDGEIIPAKVIAAYKTADVALLELVWERKNAVTVEFADSDDIKVGEQVFVVGAPYGLDHSLSSGYISGRINNRKGENPFTATEHFQTDAAINQGNSGGPMFNLEGKVIGVVSHILSESGGFQGIGFAATSNLTQELLFEKKILWSGMDGIPLTGKMARLLNLPQRSGLLVQRVVFLSPLGIMGLQGGDTEAIFGGERLIIGGDIILSFNGVTFDVTDEALNNIAEATSNLTPESTFQMEVLRGGKVITLKRD